MSEFFFFFANPKQVLTSRPTELVCRSEKPLPDGTHLFIRPPFVLVEGEEEGTTAYLFTPARGIVKANFQLFPSGVREGQTVQVLFGERIRRGKDRASRIDLKPIGEPLGWAIVPIPDDDGSALYTLYASRCNLVVPCIVEPFPVPENTEDLYKAFGL